MSYTQLLLYTFSSIHTYNQVIISESGHICSANHLLSMLSELSENFLDLSQVLSYLWRCHFFLRLCLMRVLLEISWTLLLFFLCALKDVSGCILKKRSLKHCKWYHPSHIFKRRGTENIFQDYWRVRDYNCVLLLLSFFLASPPPSRVVPCLGADCPNSITYSSFILIGCQKTGWINRWASVH